MDSMRNAIPRRWGVGLVAGLVACGAFVVGFPGDTGVHSQAGLTWTTSGRADVDVDVDISEQHGQAAVG
jgi:hypothetical protein